MTLTQLFTAIANSIRTKKGTSGTIKAEDFPDEISTITTGQLTNEEYEEAMTDCTSILENTIVPSGTINITDDGNYDVTNYVSANVNVGGNFFDDSYSITGGSSTGSYIYQSIKKFPGALPIGSSITSLRYAFMSCSALEEAPYIDTSNITNMQGMFSSCPKLTTLPLYDTGNVTTMYDMFVNCSSLTNIPQFNTEKVQIMSEMMYNCSALTNFPQLDTSKVTNFRLMFQSCTNLTTIPELDFSSGTNLENMFQNCSSLSNDSLNNILASCITATSLSTKSLRYLGLSSTQATTCTGLSNWSAAQTAGWITGN